MKEEKLKANLERGKKWKDVLAKAKFEEDIKEIEWLESQKSIMEDIKAYESSLDVKEKVEEEDIDYSSKTKTELKLILDEKKIKYNDTDTKSELINLLEG